MSDTRNDPSTLIRRMAFPQGRSRALVTPMQPSVVYSIDSPDMLDAVYEGREEGYTYSREGHPNAEMLARRIDAMEHAEGGIVVGSGMAAITAVMLGLCSAGDHVIGGDQLYGKSLKLMRQDLPRLGIATDLVDPCDWRNVEAAIRPETKLILVEVVSNPTIRIADIAGIARLAKARGVKLVIDNTFTTPRGFQAYANGADVIVHSVTKLLAGHSDAMLGYAVARDPADRAAIEAASASFGLTASPFDCWLAERGLYTFDLRYDRCEENAATLAAHLATLPGVTKVLYPGRADHPEAARANELLAGRNGNMVSFEVAGGRAAANALVLAMPDLPFAPTLGDVGTTLSHPCTSSHRGLTPAARAAIGITEGFFRVSVGVEDGAALKAEFSAGVAAGAKAAQGG
ncbi:MAG: cystathionine gamma-synthase [Paracoccaceae bacterium]|jgi:cystathionine gamma-synthase